MYAIKVKLGDDDWIYVTKDTGRCDFNLEPELFDTYDEADQFVAAWKLSGAPAGVEIVEYVEMG